MNATGSFRREHRPVLDSCANEAIPRQGKGGLINHLYLLVQFEADFHWMRIGSFMSWYLRSCVGCTVRVSCHDVPDQAKEYMHSRSSHVMLYQAFG